MGVGGIASIYAIGVLLIWFGTYRAMQGEPTTHGQDVLLPMGCIAGLLWPLVVAYLVIGSPYFAWMLWKTRGER